MFFLVFPCYYVHAILRPYNICTRVVLFCGFVQLNAVNKHTIQYNNIDSIIPNTQLKNLNAYRNDDMYTEVYKVYLPRSPYCEGDWLRSMTTAM